MDRPRYQNIVHDSVRWDGFVFRHDDIVISTPVKCGTTWTQMICALLVFQTPELETSLDLISPWLDMLTRDRAEVVADLDAQTHRRFIKSHTPLDGLPYDPQVTYICVGRDPRDVFRSRDSHMENMDIGAVMTARRAAGTADTTDTGAAEPPPRAATELERFWIWVDDDQPRTQSMTLPRMMHHLQTFWDARNRPNVILLHYNDFQTDLEGEMRRLATRLDIAVPEERWPALVEAATFESMREHADVIAPDTTNAIWRDNKRFFNRGRSGQWHDVLDAAALEHYEQRVGTLASPDVVRWAHSGGRV